MAIKYDLLAGGETYTGKDGKEKRKWIRCGVVIENSKGNLACKIETVPVNFDGWLQLKEPRPRDENASPEAKSNTSFDDMPDDIPF